MDVPESWHSTPQYGLCYYLAYLSIPIPERNFKKFWYTLRAARMYVTVRRDPPPAPPLAPYMECSWKYLTIDGYPLSDMTRMTAA